MALRDRATCRFGAAVAALARTLARRRRHAAAAGVVAVLLLAAAHGQPALDRGDFLGAMDRLHAFYRAPEGLQRPDGLSIAEAPDFQGIAAWIFDIYLTCRTAGLSADDAWSEVVASITQSEEWRSKHPGEAPRTPRGCRTTTGFDRLEFLRTIERLDAFYRAAEGLQRGNGLSIGGAPDFLGIAAWVFDVYLNARLRGQPADAAWARVVSAIEATDEWRQKHPDAGRRLRFAVIGDFGLAGEAAREVAALVASWGVDVIITTGDNNYPNGAAATIDDNVGQYYADFLFPYAGRFASAATRNRFFPTLGNHDWETAGAAPYLAYFTLPGNERYYDFVEPPVHFFALDSDPQEPDGISAASAQGRWLQARLAASTQPYRVVYMHHAPFSSAENGSTAAMQWPYAAWGATAVVAGHDHTYERISRDGIVYFVNGAGGHGRYTFVTTAPGSVVRYNGDFGAMRVDVDRAAATFQFITRAGTVIDTHTVAPRPRP